MPNPRDLLPLLVPAPREVSFFTPRERRLTRPDLPARTADLLRGGLDRLDWNDGFARVHPDLLIIRGGGGHTGESYALEVHPASMQLPTIDLIALDLRGLRAGLHTLAQLLRQYGPELPALCISDRPAFPTRGLMLDISRNKVPTQSQLKLTIDQLASLKFNHLQLYTEHTFAYRGHEEVWADASPITPEEVRELDDYAHARGIELAANQNCFGHLATWLKRPGYNHLAEIEADGLWKFMQWDRRGPFSLCPILPESEDLIRDLLGQLLPHFRSSLVNIGCDETFDVGCGRSAAEVQQRAAADFAGDESAARASLFFDFVNKICAIARSHNKRPMMWADIALHHPDMLARLGKDTIGLAWGYEPDAKFAEECAHLNRHGLEAWVCPGTSTWRSITGRTTESRGNLHAAAACAGQATGFLICDWGDVGHMQQWPLTMARLADAAEAAWNGPAARFDDTHAHASSLHVFNDDSLTLAPWIDRLGDLDLGLRTRCKVRNATAIFNDLFPPVPPSPGHRYLKDAPLEEWQKLELPQPAGLGRGPDSPLIQDELAHTLTMARLAIDHGASCRRAAVEGGDGLTPRPVDRPRLRALAQANLADLRRLWTIRNRPGGLDTAGTHLQRLIDSLA